MIRRTTGLALAGAIALTSLTGCAMVIDEPLRSRTVFAFDAVAPLSSYSAYGDSSTACDMLRSGVDEWQLAVQTDARDAPPVLSACYRATIEPGGRAWVVEDTWVLGVTGIVVSSERTCAALRERLIRAATMKDTARCAPATLRKI